MSGFCTASCDSGEFSPLKRPYNFERFSAETPIQLPMFSAETPIQDLCQNRWNPSRDKGFQLPRARDK